jgi:hypothetical protein
MRISTFSSVFEQFIPSFEIGCHRVEIHGENSFWLSKIRQFGLKKESANGREMTIGICSVKIRRLCDVKKE